MICTPKAANLTYLGYYDMRVAGDIKPAVKLFEETYGGKIDYIDLSQPQWEGFDELIEQYDKMAEFEKINNYNIVADFSTGFDTNTSNLISNMLIDIAFNQESEGWAVLRESNLNTINTVIDNLNAA